ncbi:Rieske 2Fe-2S domain-containing protein [Rhodococcus sp. YH1]|uniref:Rieske 2Fe-2S domain-containing protein n=1 Tax=Rhodococcus sp. YH1 TaxID=89066 RepID=UPI0013876722|nr:Phthalate 4,5-dioxygenase oxygenase subunit [Rhodococcus sp. YH1]
MLSHEDNELLTRVDGEAPMGAYLREYWTPAVRSQRLIADGAPVQVRLFGEDFVAFRATDGRVGFLDESCPHRGASLALARNEDCALRCIYHGWKIDVSGTVVEVPSEPADRLADMADKITIGKYPTREAGGVVWVYLGVHDDPPAFPQFPFDKVPADHVRALVAETHCNWLQAVEGTLDSSHVSILHQAWLGQSTGSLGKAAEDSAPRYESDETGYGIRFAAIRHCGDDQHVRVTEFVMPWMAYIPTGDEDRVAIIGTPIDDEHSRQWFIRWNDDHPLTEDTDTHFWYRDLTGAPDDFTELVRGRGSWGQDRSLMSDGHFSGFTNLILEDVAIQESQGPIVDRSKEKLGTSDIAVVKTRRLMLDSVRAHQEDGTVFGRKDPLARPGTAGVAITIEATGDWRTAAAGEARYV